MSFPILAHNTIESFWHHNTVVLAAKTITICNDNHQWRQIITYPWCFFQEKLQFVLILWRHQRDYISNQIQGNDTKKSSAFHWSSHKNPVISLIEEKVARRNAMLLMVSESSKAQALILQNHWTTMSDFLLTIWIISSTFLPVYIVILLFLIGCRLGFNIQVMDLVILTCISFKIQPQAILSDSISELGKK